ncbi:MAG: amidohydrolase family protein [Planctomycetes bacterium]|nr:amidohydrolase family protein [Planctomycetota bacterium]
MAIVTLIVASTSAVRADGGEYRTPTALTHITVVIGDGQTISDATILISEGRIEAIGNSVEIPAHAEVLDASGLIAYPGFIDAHTYLGIPETERTEEERARLEDDNPDPKQGPYARTRAANRRGIRPQLRAYDLFTAEDDDLDDRRKLGITTCVVAPRTGIFGGTSMLLNLSGDPLRRAVVSDGVAAHASFSPGEPGSYPRTTMGAMAQFRQVMADAEVYAGQKRYQARHPRTAERTVTDPALQALQSVRSGEWPIIFDANSEREIHRALDMAAEFKLKVIISGAKEAYKLIDRLAAERVSLLVSLKFDDEPEYDPEKEDKRAKKFAKKPDPEHPALYEPLRVRQERRRLWEEQVDNVIRLHEGGVRFALTSREFDSPKGMFKSLRQVIERGLPVEAAVDALTREPARIFGVGKHLGTLDASKIANVTVMTGRLGEKKSKIRWVFVDGKKFEFNTEDDKKDKDGDKEKSDRDEESDPDAETEEEDEPTEDEDEDVEDEEDSADEEPAVFPMPTWPTEIEEDRKPATRTGGDVLLRNATIITLASQTIQRGSILIQNGIITALGDVRDVPPEVTIIEATGRTIIPGFVDAHSHMALDSINEGTLSITPEVRLGDVVNNKQVSIYRALAGGMTTMHSMHGSANPIGGQNVLLKLKYGADVKDMLFPNAPRTVKFALGENVKQSNWGSERGTRFPGTRMGVESTFRQAFTAAQRYTDEWAKYEARVAAGEDVPPIRRDLRLEALTEIMAGDIGVHCHCYRSDEILRLFAVAEDFGFRIMCLQHVLEGYRIAPEIARHGCGASTFSNFWSYKMEAYDAIPYNAASMADAGICSSINSDSSNIARYFNLEAAKSIKWGGLSAEDALALVTINPARQLAIDDRVGSIEVGKHGDLAVFDGHPLNSLSKCVMTLIDGEVYFEHPNPSDGRYSLPDLPPDDLNRELPQSPYGMYAIVGATVHPISGPPIHNATVTIRDGKIEAVGTEVTIRPGSGIIQAAGLHVYPGLIDAASRIGLTEIGSVHGTNDMNDLATYQPDLRASSAVNPHSAHVRIARAAGITSVLAQPGGGRISGQSSLIHLDGWTMPEMLLADPVALHMGVPVLPVHLTGKDKKKRKKSHEESLRELDEWVSRAKRYSVERAADLSPRGLKSAARSELGADVLLDAMLPYVSREKPVVMSASSYKAIKKHIEFAEKHNLELILSSGGEAWKLADELAEKKIPVILTSTLSPPLGCYEVWDSVYRCAVVLDEAGVEFCFATGSAAGAYDLPFHAGMAAAHGLDPDRAVYALTLGPAKILGVDDRVGSIEPGKVADLIVTTHSPIQTVCQVTHMFIDGVPVELGSKHTDDYVRFKNRPPPTLPPGPELRGPRSLTRTGT